MRLQHVSRPISQDCVQPFFSHTHEHLLRVFTFNRQRSQSAKNLHETLYGSLPRSMRSEVLVRAKVEATSGELERRRRLVASTSVGELSQIRSFSEIPLPAGLTRLLSKSSKDVRDGASTAGGSKRTSMSNLSTREGMYSTLPRALTTRDVLVRSRTEDPEILKERRALAQSKSVSELAAITSFSDLPIPAAIERLLGGGSKKESSRPKTPDSEAPKNMHDKFYASLPRSLKADVHVRSRVEDPETLNQRRAATQTMSVSELARISGFSDMPLPSTVERALSGKWRTAKSEGSRPESRTSEAAAKESGAYGTLPRSLKKEVLVSSKVKEDDEEVRRRMELAGARTPAELGQIHSFSEIPVPRMIENWLHSNDGDRSVFLL
jgi:hypothetical protein